MMSTCVTIVRSRAVDMMTLAINCRYLLFLSDFDAGSRKQMSLAFIKENRNPSGKIAWAEKVFVEHGDFMRAILRFHVRNEVEREDLFQDFFLELISKPIPEDVQNVRGYIYRILCDNIKDAFRRIERYQKRLHRYAEHRRHINEDRPENELIETEEIDKMFELICRHLPKNEAKAMALRYRHNYNIRETAGKMGVKSRSVSRYLSTGAKKLRQVLGGVGERESTW